MGGRINYDCNKCLSYIVIQVSYFNVTQLRSMQYNAFPELSVILAVSDQQCMEANTACGWLTYRFYYNYCCSDRSTSQMSVSMSPCPELF